MCGIYAGFNIQNWDNFLDFKREVVEKNLKGLRGKDYLGTWENKDLSVCIMHSLLSISGSSKIIQPIKYNNKIYVFNGEIYSFGKLNQKILKEKKFNKNEQVGDTDKLIYCIENFGINDTLISINGMYSILVFDLKLNIIQVANDPYEQKPLYFSIFKNQIFFSSVQSLISDTKKLSPSAYDESICFSYPINFGSIYKNVQKVKGGYKYVFKLSDQIEVNISQYYKTFAGFKREARKSKNNFPISNYKLIKLKIIESIQRTVQDLDSINLLLSGGIDSTLIAAVITKELNLEINAHHLFGYSNKDYQDFKRLKKSKKLLPNMNLLTYKFSNKGVEEFLYKNPEILLNAGYIPLSSLLAQMPSNERVILSGLGADELFLGYGRHFNNFYKSKGFSFLIEVFRRKCKKILNVSTRLNYFTLNKYSHYLEIKDPFIFSKVKRYLKIKFPESINESTIQEHDINHALTKFFNPTNDIVGMFFSKEIRSPFLDLDITNELKKLNFSYEEMIGKKVLKSMLIDYGFSKDWIFHNKIGFGPDTNETVYQWKKNQIINNFNL